MACCQNHGSIGGGFEMKKTRLRSQALNGSKQISFLPVPKFNPKLPPKHTLHDVALGFLLRGIKLTSLDFQRRTSSQRLAAYIHDLIKSGWPVLSDDIVVTVDEEPKNRVVSEYYLEDEVVSKYKKYLGGRQ